MKAAVFYDVDDIRLEEVPEPEIGDEDVLVEVTACGICGSDLEYYMGRSPVGTADGKGPLILGHEFAGKVVKVGKDAEGLAEGDRVAVNPIQSSASGDFSRSGNPHFDLSVVLGVTTNGAFAKYVRTKAEHAHKLPDSMSDEQGAFVEMLAASLNAVEKADIRLGDLVVIYGPGPVGLSMVQLAKASGGARRDRRHARLPARAGEGAWAPSTCSTSPTRSSPYYTADLAASIQGVNARRAGRQGDRRDGVVEAATQGALDVTGNGSTIVYMGLAGPDDIVKLPMLSSLAMDKTHPLLLALPQPVAEHDPAAARGRRRHVEDHHPLDRARRDRRGIRQVVARDDGVIKNVVRPGG